MATWLALAQGDLALAVRWVQERQLRVEDELSPPREIEYQTLARLLDLAEQQGRMGNALKHLVLQAVAQQACGDEAGALGALARALSLAEPEGYIRLFVDEGLPMARLLVQLRTRRGSDQPGSTGYRDHLLALLGRAHDEDVSHSAVAVPGSGTYSLGEPLSERELEVLRLIVAGYSNREIADRLVIAVSTVKWYVNAIYSKLQVESRTKAIARARELNIV